MSFSHEGKTAAGQEVNRDVRFFSPGSDLSLVLFQRSAGTDFSILGFRYGNRVRSIRFPERQASCFFRNLGNIMKPGEY